MGDNTLESAKDLREKAQETEDDTVREHGGNREADWTLSYKPGEQAIVLAIRPNDFEKATAKRICDEICGHFGKNCPHLEEKEATAFLEFVGLIDWSPSSE